jgi:hypothetical protein
MGTFYDCLKPVSKIDVLAIGGPEARRNYPWSLSLGDILRGGDRH